MMGSNRGVMTVRARGGNLRILALTTPFPQGFVTCAMLSDMLYWQSGDAAWAGTSFWLLAGAAAGGAVLVLLGLADRLRQADGGVPPAAGRGLIGAAVGLALALINMWLRDGGDPSRAILPWGLLLSLATCAAMDVAGGLGRRA